MWRSRNIWVFVFPAKTEQFYRLRIQFQILAACKFSFCIFKWDLAWIISVAQDLVPEIIDSGPMCITDLFQNKGASIKYVQF